MTLYVTLREKTCGEPLTPKINYKPNQTKKGKAHQDLSDVCHRVRGALPLRAGQLHLRDALSGRAGAAVRGHAVPPGRRPHAAHTQDEFAAGARRGQGGGVGERAQE